MEIESLHKYITLNKLPNDTVEIMFSGQSCLTVSKVIDSYFWRINPIFAKLMYGANLFSDIPFCADSHDTTETAIAAGLVKLHELGAFSTIVDLPEDSYAATLTSIQEDVKRYSIGHTKSLFEAHILCESIMDKIKTNTLSIEEERGFRSEYAANAVMSKEYVAPKPKVKLHKLKDKSGAVVSTHETESGAITAFNNLSNKSGIKIVRESDEDDSEIDVTPVEIVPESAKKIDIFSKWVSENSDKDYDDWEKTVRETHPTKKLKFKGRIESGVDTISAEEPGVDRSYGVWDNKTNKGHVFKLDERELTDDEEAKKEEIVKALKSDKKFMADHDKDSVYAIATAKAKATE